ncbi:MAG: cytochrome c [Ferruginibacter sp.]
MKRFKYIAALLLVTVVISVVSSSCGGVKRHPGTAYMPDMAYSRAYETYIERDTNFTMSRDSADKYHRIFYNNRTVAGTMRQGEMMPYELSNDSNGYKMSAMVKNPLPPLNAEDSAEAGRLFNINCAICHDAKGTGQGPIFDKIGAVANLTDPKIAALSDGTMFHVITYGKNNMGSYASQLSRKQRWMIIHYVRTLQPKDSTGAKPAVMPNTGSMAKKDSTATVKK